MTTSAPQHPVIARPKVTVAPAPDRGPGWFRMTCEHCTEEYANCAKTDVAEHARIHRANHRNGRIEVTR